MIYSPGESFYVSGRYGAVSRERHLDVCKSKAERTTEVSPELVRLREEFQFLSWSRGMKLWNRFKWRRVYSLQMDRMEGQQSISLSFVFSPFSGLLSPRCSTDRCLPVPPASAPILPQSLLPLMWTVAHVADSLYLLQFAWLGAMLSLLHPWTREEYDDMLAFNLAVHILDTRMIRFPSM